MAVDYDEAGGCGGAIAGAVLFGGVEGLIDFVGIEGVEDGRLIGAVACFCGDGPDDGVLVAVCRDGRSGSGVREFDVGVCSQF